jgi:demethylmenaquinone methyltransferase/2-methoxy-6-polyprenyl-1,4-benzoquinol methylase
VGGSLMPASPALPASPPDKRRYVRAMFEAVAPSYDLLNRVLSLNVDRAWRRTAIARLGWEARPDGVYLDACAGTLDLARSLARLPGFKGRVVATDFALPMLRVGRAKLDGERVHSAAADTLELPIADGTFDGALVGFGVRNLADLPAGLAELARVLRPGARLVILDFATPRAPLIRALYLLYFRRVLPVVGRLVSGHPTAYTYLPESVMKFPDPETLTRALAQAGLRDVGFQLQTFGIVAISWGVK